MGAVERNNDIPLADDGDDSTSSPVVLTSGRVRPAESLPSAAARRGGDFCRLNNDFDDCNEDQEEKAALISQVLELQNTLDELSQRVDSVKEESLKLRSENQVLGQYIENLMAASSVFQSTSPKPKMTKK